MGSRTSSRRRRSSTACTSRCPARSSCSSKTCAATIGKFELLRRLLAVRCFGGWSEEPAARSRSRRDPHKPAVVLFTSGSEKAPKAVPLTHAQHHQPTSAAAIERSRVDRDNSVLGFLPMFHSFGLTVTGLLPLFVGVRVVHHPDPTDAGGARPQDRRLQADAHRRHADVRQLHPRPREAGRPRLAAASSSSARRSAPQRSSTRRSELAPQRRGAGGLRHHRVLAGGVGEPPGAREARHDRQAAAGRRGVRHRPGDGRGAAAGQMGMLHVARADRVPRLPRPRRAVAVRGDRRQAVVRHRRPRRSSTPTGAIVFRGRLKRFLKAGGEMISLPALEEPFAKLYPPTDEGPRVAVEGVETPTGRRIVLFTTEAITLRDANALLQQEGFRGVMRLDEVRKVDKIPVLGTGKTDYKVLRGMIDVAAAGLPGVRLSPSHTHLWHSDSPEMQGFGAMSRAIYVAWVVRLLAPRTCSRTHSLSRYTVTPASAPSAPEAPPMMRREWLQVSAATTLTGGMQFPLALAQEPAKVEVARRDDPRLPRRRGEALSAAVHGRGEDEGRVGSEAAAAEAANSSTCSASGRCPRRRRSRPPSPARSNAAASIIEKLHFQSKPGPVRHRQPVPPEGRRNGQKLPGDPLRLRPLRPRPRRQQDRLPGPRHVVRHATATSAWSSTRCSSARSRASTTARTTSRPLVVARPRLHAGRRRVLERHPRHRLPGDAARTSIRSGSA